MCSTYRNDLKCGDMEVAAAFLGQCSADTSCEKHVGATAKAGNTACSGALSTTRRRSVIYDLSRNQRTIGEYSRAEGCISLCSVWRAKIHALDPALLYRSRIDTHTHNQLPARRLKSHAGLLDDVVRR